MQEASHDQGDEVPEPGAAADQEPAEQPGGAEPFEPTGHPGVDEVLSSLDGLEQREVHEHVAVFEQAHATLRRALDEAPAAQE